MLFNRYIHICKIPLFPLLFFTLIFACNSTPKEIIQENDPVFHTTAPAQLYFRNTRSHHYELITQQATKIDHYTLKTTAEDQLFYPVIANNWLSEEAYILLKSRNPAKGKLELKIDNITGFSLNMSSRKSQYEAMLTIVKAIDAGQSCCIQLEEGDCFALFDSEQEKAQLKTVMRDYFKLVERF